MAVQEKEFLQLLHQQEGRLFRIAWAMLNNEADAFDVLQETVEAAWRHRWQLHGGSAAFPAWIKRILINRSLNLLKKRQREVLVDPIDQVNWLQSAPTNIDVESMVLWDSLHQLRLEYRQVLVMRYLADLTFPQIARVLKVPLSTVKTWHIRALESIREHMQTETHENSKVVLR